MQPSEQTDRENAVKQQPIISQSKIRNLIAVVVVLGAVPVWAAGPAGAEDASLLPTATTGSAPQRSEADEAERMHQRIRQRLRERRAPEPVPYGTGYEARRNRTMEAGEGVERLERVERTERPERVDRPVIERGGRGGR